MTPLNITSTTIALDYAEALDNTMTTEVAVLPGRTYDRIISTDADGSRDILGFVGRENGVLYQPSSWSRPSLSRPTFNLHTEFDAAVAANKN